MIEQKILDTIRPQINERQLGKDIASTYGCTPPYVSRVLNGQAKYNSKLIEIALNILEQDKQKEAQIRITQAKRLGIKI